MEYLLKISLSKITVSDESQELITGKIRKSLFFRKWKIKNINSGGQWLVLGDIKTLFGLAGEDQLRISTEHKSWIFNFIENPITLVEDELNLVCQQTQDTNFIEIRTSNKLTCVVKKVITNKLLEQVSYIFTLESVDQLESVTLSCFCNKLLTFDSFWGRE